MPCSRICRRAASWVDLHRVVRRQRAQLLEADRDLVARFDVALELRFAPREKVPPLSGLGVDGEAQQVLDQVLYPLGVLDPVGGVAQLHEAALGSVHGAEIDDGGQHQYDDADRPEAGKIHGMRSASRGYLGKRISAVGQIPRC